MYYGKFIATHMVQRSTLSEKHLKLLANPNQLYPLDRRFDSDTLVSEQTDCCLSNIPIGQRYKLNYSYGAHFFKTIKDLCIGRKVTALQIPLQKQDWQDTVLPDILKIL